MTNDFKPANFYERFLWLVYVPFYSMSSFIKSSPLSLVEGQITHVNTIAGAKNRFFVYYTRPDFHGYFIAQKLPENLSATLVKEISKLDQLKIVINRLKEHGKKYIFQFYLISPSATLIVSFCLAQEAIIYGQSYLFSADQFVSPDCNMKCAQKIIQNYAILALKTTSLLLMAGIPLLFFFAISLILSILQGLPAK